MIDRSYLPFPSAREYQDRKMAKWMGFFLSEHSTSLIETRPKETFSKNLSLEQIYLYLSQLYLHQTLALIQVKERNKVLTYEGIVTSLSKHHALVKTDKGYVRILLENLLDIMVTEEVYDEPA